MRIMSFARRWEKLERKFFTTFRYPRKDNDWKVGERVQIFIQNRSPHRVFLGIAEIVSRVPRTLDSKDNFPGHITHNEAIADGFNNLIDMESFMKDFYGRDFNPVFNKLTLKWI